MLNKRAKSDNDFLGKVSRITEGTIIKGDIISETDFRIDGKLVGNFQSKEKIIIGLYGELIGDVICKNADIDGKLEGKIKVEECLTLRTTGRVHGEVICGDLVVESGAKLDINCLVKSNEEIEEIQK